MTILVLDEQVSVAGQIFPDEVAGLAAQGFTLIVNNRPDDEENDQPPSAAIEQAAAHCGVAYRHFPMSGGITADMIESLRDALEGSGKALLFCRSGTRSTYLWALARHAQGVEGADLLDSARRQGFDLTPLRTYLLRPSA